MSTDACFKIHFLTTQYLVRVEVRLYIEISLIYLTWKSKYQPKHDSFVIYLIFIVLAPGLKISQEKTILSFAPNTF